MAVQLLNMSRSASSTPQSAATRARIVAVAERMFAEQGINGVSLHDINAAAGQRNKTATHYHFKDRNGLVQAILDKHMPGIIADRHKMLDDMDATGEPTLHGIVKAILYPVARKLFDGDGGHDFIRISAQLVVDRTLLANKLHAITLKMNPQDRLCVAYYKVLSQLPPAIAAQRAMMMEVLVFEGLADHSRLQSRADIQTRVTSTELFILNLEDSLVSMLAAPVSQTTLDVLKGLPKDPKLR